MVMLCLTGVNPIGPNWGENALVTKYSGTLELLDTLMFTIGDIYCSRHVILSEVIVFPKIAS